MSETVYRRFESKGGRVKYVPVGQNEDLALGALPQGTHLVVVRPGIRSTYFSVDPDFAALVGASTFALDAMSDAILRASELRPNKSATSKKERDAFEAWLKATSKQSRYLLGSYASAREIAEVGVRALVDAAKEYRARKSRKTRA